MQARQYSTPGDKQFEAIFENAIHMELHRLLLRWLNESNAKVFSQAKVESMALAVSWGVFGSALQWSRNPQSRSVKWMIEEIIELYRAISPLFWRKQPGINTPYGIGVKIASFLIRLTASTVTASF